MWDASNLAEFTILTERSWMRQRHYMRHYWLFSSPAISLNLVGDAVIICFSKSIIPNLSGLSSNVNLIANLNASCEILDDAVCSVRNYLHWYRFHVWFMLVLLYVCSAVSLYLSIILYFLFFLFFPRLLIAQVCL